MKQEVEGKVDIKYHQVASLLVRGGLREVLVGLFRVF